MRIDHPIFQTPFSVTPTLESLPTPAVYRDKASGEALGETLPMWRVQTEGYKDGTDQLIGIVSSDAGFMDAPDAEWISGGVNTKDVNAVALGRHGNFFHWGFAASPTYLTEEGKMVLVNALHYIAKFDGQGPVARKRAGSLPRTHLERIIAGTTAEGYAKTLERYAEFRAREVASKAELQAKKEAGKKLSKTEQRQLDSAPIEDPGQFDRVRYIFPKATWEALEKTPEAMATFMQQNRDYLYCNSDRRFRVDEDLKKLGIANDSLKLIPTLIDMHTTAADELADAGPQPDTLDLLKRYTEQSFETHAQWKHWLREHREHLFFSEVGGYKWLSALRAEPQSQPAKATKRTDNSNLKPTPATPLVWATDLEALGGKEYRLNVDIKILESWHAYHRVPPGQPYRAFEIEAEWPEDWETDEKWTRPKFHEDLNTPGMFVFDGFQSLSMKLTAPEGFDGKDLDGFLVTVHFQVCDARMCLAPTSEEREVETLLVLESASTR